MKFKSLLLLLTFVLLGQSINAQDCNSYFPFEPDTKMEMTYYNKKGKTTSTTEIIVNDITETDGVVEAELTSVVSDKKGEKADAIDFRVKCTGNGYEIDITNMLNPETLKAIEGMEIDMTGDALNYPNDLSVGKTLNDANATIEASTGGVKVLTMKFNITNRKVEAQESVTTKAGTFDCYKITYNFDFKWGIIKKKQKVTQWIADGVGVVKDEIRNKKGKLESTSELTKLEKP